MVRKLNRAGEALTSNRPALERTALTAKSIFQGSAASAGVLGRKPSGTRKAINARYDFKSAKQDLVDEVVVFYTGPAHLVNNPTKPHYIVAKHLAASRGAGQERARLAGAASAFGGSARGAFGALQATRTTRRGTRARAGKRALTIDSNLRAYAAHPGTKGKHFFEKARAATTRVAPRIFQREGIREPLRRVFK